ncbi:MAG: hypothetical protein LCH61_18080 [Proteobacteria bacterium]|nr:hypothetical protein [Pseudomonadota bacterium]
MTPKKPPTKGPVSNAASDTPALDATVQDRLGDMLKQHFDDLLSAPVPDQFLVLLAELEAKEQASDQP